MSIRLTILGKSPSWQDTDGACSGYLIETDGHNYVKALAFAGHPYEAPFREKLRRHLTHVAPTPDRRLGWRRHS